MAGKQVRLFLVDGTAGGLVTAEIMNWTGHLLKGKREQLATIRQRSEAQRTGVYILLGEDPATGGRLAYIGQSDDVAKRLLNHDAKKDFWDEVVVVTSKDTNLTSAHVRYIEAQLIRLAKSIGRVPLENGNEPTGGADPPEADASDMNYFIDQLRIVLPVLGVDLFRGRATRPTTGGRAAVVPGTGEARTATALETESSGSPIFLLQRAKLGVDARAQVIDGEFTMLAGSTIVPAMRHSKQGHNSAIQQAYEKRQVALQGLIDDGSVRIENGNGVLTRDVVFSSPSAAGATALGQAALNGRTAWLTEDGLIFADWESGVHVAGL
ncbi:GIY-YIG nuclease family protein [Zhihengliuella somnathii]